MIINVHIENATPEEVARLFGSNTRLAEAVMQQGTTAPKAVEKPVAVEEPNAPEPPKAEEPAAKKTTTRSRAKKEEPAPKAEEPAPAEVATPEEEQGPTFDDLRELLTTKAQAGKDVKSFLNGQGFEKLSAVPADKIAEVFEKAGAL